MIGIKMALEKTKWEMTIAGITTIIEFGVSVSTSGTPGGYGTSTAQYKSGPISINIMWIEDWHGNFMYQIKGPTDPGTKELPTFSGVYKGAVALGWATNFDAAWGAWDVTMKQI